MGCHFLLQGIFPTRDQTCTSGNSCTGSRVFYCCTTWVYSFIYLTDDDRFKPETTMKMSYSKRICPIKLSEGLSFAIMRKTIILLFLPLWCTSYIRLLLLQNVSLDLIFRKIFEKWTSLVAQMVKHLPKMWETQVRFLGWEDPLEKEMSTHSSTLAWKIPWTEEHCRLQSMGSQKVGHDWATSFFEKCTSKSMFHLL